MMTVDDVKEESEDDERERRKEYKNRSP